MFGRRLTVLGAALALGACGACSKSSEGNNGGTSAPAPHVTAGSDKAAPEPTEVQTGADATFQLAFSNPDPVAPGSQAIAKLTITPGKGYHINQDFKPKLTMTPPDGVTLAKNELEVADAPNVTMDKTQLVFTVQATAKTAGAYKVPGKIKFAVCADDDSDCEPKRRSVEFTMTAK